jgi:Skp family chaperone for outer membrane proteins
MRILAAILLGVALTAGAGAQTLPEARVLVFDRDALKTSGLDDVREDVRKIAEKIVEDLTQGYGANIVLDRSAIVLAGPAPDITAQVLFALKDALPGWQSAKQYADPNTAVVPIHPLDLDGRIAVVDRLAIVKTSMVGVDVARQAQAFVHDAENALRPEAESLGQEKAHLQNEAADLPDDEKKQRIADFDSRKAAFDKKVQQRHDQIKAAVAVVQKEMERTAGPIVQNIAESDGAIAVIDKQAVIFCDPKFDVTSLAIQRLDAAMPRADVVLQPAPDQIASP